MNQEQLQETATVPAKLPEKKVRLAFMQLGLPCRKPFAARQCAKVF